jgi:enolase
MLPPLNSGYQKKKVYDLDFKTENNDGSKCLSGKELAALYVDWVNKYPLVSIEDPFDQDDWDSYAHLVP